MVGIVTDAAMVYVQYGHLRRAVDAGAVAAVNQYREGRTPADLYNSVAEAIQLQLPDAQNVRFYWCDEKEPNVTVQDIEGVDYKPHVPWNPADREPYHGDTLCHAPGERPRKRVRVQADVPVDLIFLSMVWHNQVIIHNAAEAEAAILNMVLLLDTSESMAYGGCGGGEQELYDCLVDCTANENCDPFHTVPGVRWAAYQFVDALMRDEVDRVAVYHFDRTPVITQSVETVHCRTTPVTLTFPVTITPSSGIVVPLTTTKDLVLTSIMSPTLLNVYVRPEACDADSGECCDSPVQVGGYWGQEGPGYGYRWANTNIGGGLREAVGELVSNGSTDAAIWIIVLLSDGAANATDQAADENEFWTCPAPAAHQPPNYRDRWQPVPFCRDPEVTDADPENPNPATVTRHCPSLALCTDPARCDDAGDPSTCWYTNWGETITETIMWNYDADDYARDIADLASSQAIGIYTVGFGPKVISESRGRADAGERLLRYIADVGDDGDLETAPCGSDFYWDDVVSDPTQRGEDCGNYYFAQTAADLEDVFESIASRIFSRITQ